MATASAQTSIYEQFNFDLATPQKRQTRCVGVRGVVISNSGGWGLQ